MATWQVQQAKARLSELLDHAEADGPQTISKHGRPRAVVVAIDEYRRLVTARPDFTSYLLGGPKVDDFDIPRDRDLGRDVAL